tara:strand:+ start:136 stop:1236 length:1101 start_codon:yes stop_codon:yes gene_type:complete
MTDASNRLYPPTNEVMCAHAGEPSDASYPSADFKPMCRICLETDAPDDDPLIAPCRCSGSMKWVHRKCLNEWRAQEQVPLSFTHCPQCKFQYRTELDEGEKTFKNLKLTVFVARDTIGLFLLVQAFLAGVAFLMHACDPDGAIAKLYPEKWAESKAALHFSVGPYYVTTCIGSLAILGFVGLCLWCAGKLPGQTSEARNAPRWRRPRSEADCCPGGACPTCDNCELVYCINCDNVCPRNQRCDCCPGESCDCNCDNACKCDNCSGEAAPALVAVGLALLAIFVLIGLVVGFFFSVIIVQRIVQKHVNLLHMRGESKVHRVLDLATRPELLDAPRDDAVAYEAPSTQLLGTGKPGSSSDADAALPDI